MSRTGGRQRRRPPALRPVSVLRSPSRRAFGAPSLPCVDTHKVGGRPGDDGGPQIAGGGPMRARRGPPGMIPRAGEQGEQTTRATNALSIAAMLCWGAAYVPSALAGRDLAAPGRPPAPAWRLGGVLLLVALAALGRPAAPGVGPSRSWLAGAHPDGALLRGDLLGHRPRRGGPVGGPRQHRPAVRGGPRGAGPRRAARGRQWAGLAVGLVGAACVVWEGPLWPPAARDARRSWWWAGRSPGASAPWWPPAACAAARRPARRWRAGRWPRAGVVLASAGRARERGRPARSAPARSPCRGASPSRARRCRWRSSTWPWRGRPPRRCRPGSS